MTTLPSISRSEKANAFSITQPLTVSIAFFLIVVALRSIDAFVLRLGALPDENIVSRVLGFLLVLGFLWVVRKPLSSTGLHGRNFGKAALIGALSLIALYGILYAVQFNRLRIAGEMPRLVVGAIDPETNAMGGLFFSSFFLAGQVINAFMEEAIFRGVILPHLMRRMRFGKANLLQAFLFGLAHLVFPLSSWLSGQTTAMETASASVMLMAFTTVGGLVFGYLYYRTGSLWTAVFAHLLDNIIGLFFHIQTLGRLNAETGILFLASIGLISLVLLAWAVSKRANLPALKPWGASE